MQSKDTVLVTGGTGFIAMRIILQLVQQGYSVRATVRSISSSQKIVTMLQENDYTNTKAITFVETELTEDANWEQAMTGCRYVLSVASPVFFTVPKNESEAIKPAVEGIQRILKFAKKTGVQRVVMTSNFGAVGFSQTDKTRVTTEKDWTDLNTPGLSVYEKSKTMAEKAAWKFIKTQSNGLEFATINPVAVYGPALNAHVSGSFHLLTNLLNGTTKRIPNIPLNVIDVRDVASLHIKAMLHPKANGQRFIATADGQISLLEIAALLKKERPEIASLISDKTLPGWILRLASLTNKKAKEGLLFIKMNRNLSNAKAKTLLEWSPIGTQEEAVLAGVDALIEYELLNKQH